jgi:hypothetical protein
LNDCAMKGSLRWVKTLHYRENAPIPISVCLIPWKAGAFRPCRNG